MTKFSILISTFTILLFFSSCDPDENMPDPGTGGGGTDTIDSTGVSGNPERVLVLCEGAFGSNTASLSSYDKEAQTIQNGVFLSTNGYAVGDVLQSISRIEDKLYMVVNGSAKIEVLNEETLEAEEPINGFVSPRYSLRVGTSKAYVSNLFSCCLDVVDLQTNSITGNVEIGHHSEGMIHIGNKAYVCAFSGDKVMVVDIDADTVIDSIEVGAGPVNLIHDADGKLWVVTNGNFGETTPRLVRIDPETDEVMKSVELPQPWSYSIKLAVGGNGEQLYVMNNDIFTMFIGDTELDSDPLISSGASYYGIGIDPANGDIYAADATDFSSNGIVDRFDSGGSLIDQFEVGIAPNGFIFAE